MFSNFAQTERYADHLLQKSHSFLDAQRDAQWMQACFSRCVNYLGDCFVAWGQRLQTYGVTMRALNE